jgi:ABC-type sugar transport system ATPase subunit
MNIFDAAIAPEGNATSISGLSPNGQPAFRLTAPVVAGNGRRVRLGIRPHLIEIGANGSADATGKVITNHWLGDQSHICFEIGGCSVVGVTDKPVEPRPATRCRSARSAPHLKRCRSGRAPAHGLGGEEWRATHPRSTPAW